MVAQTVKNESTCNAEDLSSVPESGRSSGEGNGYPFQYSCLENPMDRGYSPWYLKEPDLTERLTLSLSATKIVKHLLTDLRKKNREKKVLMLHSQQMWHLMRIIFNTSLHHKINLFSVIIMIENNQDNKTRYADSRKNSTRFRNNKNV